MSRQFDELAKDLAKGVSRRSAIGRFLTGLGATVAGVLLTGRKAHAESHAQVCIDHCKTCYDGEEYGQCMAHSVQCENPDFCAFLVNEFCPPFTNSTCQPGPSINGTDGGTWVCAPLLERNPCIVLIG